MHDLAFVDREHFRAVRGRPGFRVGAARFADAEYQRVHAGQQVQLVAPAGGTAGGLEGF